MRYLVQFLDEWTDFRYAEFFALLQLNGYAPEDVVLCCTDPDGVEYRSLDDYKLLPASDMQAHWRRKRAAAEIDHFMIVEMPSNEAILAVCARAVLVKNVFELWTCAISFEENVGATKQLDASFLEPYLSSTASWSVQVLTFGKTFTMEEKHKLRVRYSFLDFRGPVSLKQPDREFWVIVDYSRNIHHHVCSSPPFPTFFGCRIGGGAMKQALVKYDLKKRSYLGPTTLDDALAFILTNLALVKPGMMVLEPFVGTGSIAIALEHMGAYVMGTDIDPRVLRGEMYAGAESRSIHRDVRGNFSIYNLPIPDLVRMDAHLFQRHLRCPPQGFFHAIVTDPPYGIRAGAKKSGKKTEVSYQLSAEQRENHIPSTQTYPVEEVMLDLLHNAAVSLELGGTLIYLIPTTYDFSENDLPRHPCLDLLEVCHQHLSARHGRRAVVMRKNRVLDAARIEAFQAYKTRVLAGEDDGFGCLMGKLQAALAGNAYENDSVVKRLGSCGERRRQGREFRRQMREAGLAHPPKPGRRLSKKALKRIARLEEEQRQWPQIPKSGPAVSQDPVTGDGAFDEGEERQQLGEDDDDDDDDDDSETEGCEDSHGSAGPARCAVETHGSDAPRPESAGDA